MPEAGDIPTNPESSQTEVPVYGMKVSDLTQERMDAVSRIYHDVINPGSDLETIVRTLDAQEIAEKIKNNKYEDLEYRLGSSERGNAKLRIYGRHTLVDGGEIVNFAYDPNDPSSLATDEPNALEENFRKAVDNYLREQGLSVKKPETLEEAQDAITKFKLRREYMASKNKD